MGSGYNNFLGYGAVPDISSHVRGFRAHRHIRLLRRVQLVGTADDLSLGSRDESKEFSDHKVENIADILF